MRERERRKRGCMWERESVSECGSGRDRRRESVSQGERK